MQLKQILKVTLNLIQLRTYGDIATTTALAYVSTVTCIVYNQQITLEPKLDN